MTAPATFPYTAQSADPFQAGRHEHLVRFYERDATLIDAVAAFIGDAIGADRPAIVVATSTHVEQLEQRLIARGVDIEHARTSGRYIALDASQTLQSLLIEGWPDADRFFQALEPLVAAADVARSPCIFGEMVALLWGDGKHAAAVRLEQLWNELSARYPFSLLCAYSMTHIANGPAEALLGVCSEHSSVIPAESYSSLEAEPAKLSEICTLQQRSTALEMEIERHKATSLLLTARERELSEFLECAALAIHSVDGDGTILWANRHELAMLGYAAEEYVGRNIAEFYVESREAAAVLQRLHNGETLHDEPVTMRCKDGSIREVVVTSNVRWQEGSFVQTRCFSRDVTDERRAVRARRESEDGAAHMRSLLAAIVESSDDAIISKSLAGRITSWNQGAERLYGYTAEETLGQSIMMLMPPDLWHEEEQIIDKLSRGERIVHFETRRVTKDGRQIPVSLTISPVRDNKGQVIGASKVARDISDRKRMEEQLRDADRRKDEFMAMLGHELRNPLAPIRNVAELLRRKTAGNADCAQLCDMLERQVKQMTRLLDDLLDVSRIAQGKIEFRRERLELKDVVKRAVEASQPVIDSRGHRLIVSLTGGVSAVEGDAGRLVQMMTNLLNNAAKYTPAGGTIELSLVRCGARVEIRVKDNGIGIAPEMLPRIFDLFVQAERGGDAQEGLGIGLTLVRKIAQRHGGDVEALSAGPGQGSEFVVSLPLAEKAVNAANAADHDTTPGVTPRRIVILDDNRDSSESLATLLRLIGHEVSVAADGPSGMQLIHSVQPDFALLDIGLPGMDGYEVARRLRRGGCAVPLIAITGYGASDDRDRSKAAGFNHHLVKPVDAGTLDTLFAQWGDSTTGLSPQ